VSQLRTALRHVRRGEQIVATQRMRVAYLERAGHTEAVESSRALLHLMEESLSLHRQHLEKLQRAERLAI